MAIDDRVQPLKLEDPATGGDEVDQFPTALDRNEDYIDCRGLTLQDASSNDTTVRIERSASGDIQLVDQVNATPITLTQLISFAGFNPDMLLMSNDGNVLVSHTGNVLVNG